MLDKKFLDFVYREKESFSKNLFRLMEKYPELLEHDTSEAFEKALSGISDCFNGSWDFSTIITKTYFYAVCEEKFQTIIKNKQKMLPFAEKAKEYMENSGSLVSVHISDLFRNEFLRLFV